MSEAGDAPDGGPGHIFVSYARADRERVQPIVAALDKQTGALLWKTKLDDDRSALITQLPAIVGDTIYGTAPRSGGPMLHLHARDIAVPLYKNREPIRATAPVPDHMHALLAACGWQNEPSSSPATSLQASDVI